MRKKKTARTPIGKPKSHVRVLGPGNTGGTGSIVDVTNTPLHRGRGEHVAVALTPDKNNKMGGYLPTHGKSVAEGRGASFQEAFNNASTARTEGLKSGAFAKPNPADESWAKTSREQVAQGNPNYKPAPVIKINSGNY